MEHGISEKGCMGGLAENVKSFRAEVSPGGGIRVHGHRDAEVSAPQILG